jgi:hypothetical protein
LLARNGNIERATWSVALPPRGPMKKTVATLLVLVVARTAPAQMYFAGPDPAHNFPRQSYQPGQVAVSTNPGSIPVSANPPAQNVSVVGNQPLGTYQPGQVAITGVQQGGSASGGTTTVTSSYNGFTSSDGSGAQAFSSAFAPSGIGDAVGAGVSAAFGLTGTQTSYRRPFIQQPTYGSQYYNMQRPQQPTYGSQYYNMQRPQQPTYGGQPHFPPRLYSSFQR